ncbi:MAG: hypothetical protein WD512_15060 [Candidatus Paceibacterota bacterium]
MRVNLEELKNLVDSTVEHLYDKESKDVPLSINISEPSMGARAYSSVKYIGMGMDWEHGQLRITPEDELVRKGNSLKDVKHVDCRPYDGRNYYFCPRCQQKISKNDIYCRYCAQKLK